jgi:hypothetical protein
VIGRAGDDPKSGADARRGQVSQQPKEASAMAKKTSPTKSSGTKRKTTARKNATKKMEGREGRAPGAKVRGSDQKVSQSRFPGETPLAGEDRPANRAGGKRGQGSKRKAK